MSERSSRFRFDRVGTCTAVATRLVEGYSPADGRAHGSLDVTVHVCQECLGGLRERLWRSGMTPYTCVSASGRVCGERTIFDDNEYVKNYPG